MTSQKKANREGQAMYLGRWVDKSTFRAFVYGANGEQKLANSYPEFESLTANGLWFAELPPVSSKLKGKKDGSSNS